MNTKPDVIKYAAEVMLAKWAYCHHVVSHRSCCGQSGDGSNTKLQHHQGGDAGAHHGQRPGHEQKLELPNESGVSPPVVTGGRRVLCVTTTVRRDKVKCVISMSGEDGARHNATWRGRFLTSPLLETSAASSGSRAPRCHKHRSVLQDTHTHTHTHI